MAALIGGGVLVFVVGFLGGSWWRRGRDEDRRMAVRLERELSEARADLERYRERVSQHFEKSSDLFRDLTSQYSSLYKHLAEGARDLARPGIPAFEPLPEAPRLESQRPADGPGGDPGVPPGDGATRPAGSAD
jgi:uncharacterized membrane-anchored protein YhcB (DUF1043 family)